MSLRSTSTRLERVTRNYSWTIESFELVQETIQNSDPARIYSEEMTLFPDCCSIKFSIGRERTSTQVNDTDVYDYNYFWLLGHLVEKGGTIPEHMKSKHGIVASDLLIYLIGSGGEKTILTHSKNHIQYMNTIFSQKDKTSDDNRFDFLCNGSLELRFVETLTKLKHVCNTLPGPPRPLENLATNLSHLLETGQHSDFTILIQDGTIKVHKMVLAARSPVLAKMLSVDMKEKNENSMCLDHLDPKVVKRFIHYIYTDMIEPPVEGTEVNLFLELLKLADQYQISRLKALAEIELIRELSVNNAVEFIKFADTFGYEDLLNAALEFINSNRSILSQKEVILDLISHSKQLEKHILESLTCAKLSKGLEQ